MLPIVAVVVLVFSNATPEIPALIVGVTLVVLSNGGAEGLILSSPNDSLKYNCLFTILLFVLVSTMAE